MKASWVTNPDINILLQAYHMIYYRRTTDVYCNIQVVTCSSTMHGVGTMGCHPLLSNGLQIFSNLIQTANWVQCGLGPGALTVCLTLYRGRLYRSTTMAVFLTALEKVSKRIYFRLNLDYEDCLLHF